MAARKPSTELKSFGTEVTRLREAAGLNRTELAARAAVSRSYISQVESGNTRCREDFAQRLDKTLDTDPVLTDAWNDLLRSAGYPRYFTDFSVAESSATMLRSFQTTYVDGLLQTEAYARVLLRSEDAVKGRLRRQGILTRESPPLLCVALDESVLHREVGDHAVMREQCEHLLTLSTWENIALQVAPMAYYRGVSASFTIATQADRTEVVYLKNAAGGETSTDADQLTRVTETFVRLQSRAMSVHDSRNLIRRMVSDRWT